MASMQEDRDERQVKRDRFRSEIVPTVVKELGKLEPERAWHLMPEDKEQDHNRPPHIRSVDGEEIYISYNEYENRITSHGVYGQTADGRQWIPRDSLRDFTDPAPSVAFDRPPAAIAKDITRRLLPDYRIALLEYRRRVHQDTNHRAAILALFSELCAIAPAMTTWRNEWDKSPERKASLSNLKGVSYGDLVVNSGDSVRFEVSCDAEMAKSILRALASGELATK